MPWTPSEPMVIEEVNLWQQLTRKRMNRRIPISSREAKIVWLLSHPTLWERTNPDDDQNWLQIVRLMKVDGLIAGTTSTHDVNVPRLIADAQRH